MSDLILPHRWPGAPLQAVLLERENKFLARCALASGAVVRAHVPDRGRCLDLLVPGQPLWLVAAAPRTSGPVRRTAFTALLARARTPPWPWVSLDPAGAPRLVEAALEAGLVPSLAGLRVVARERAVSLGAKARGRIDLLLEGDVLCEVKSAGAARAGVALFPDAPTLRGGRHLAFLARRARRGLGAAVVFCAQRGDARAVAADRAIDPAFAAALERARRAGVRVCGLSCEARAEGMRIVGEIPVR